MQLRYGGGLAVGRQGDTVEVWVSRSQGELHLTHSAWSAGVPLGAIVESRGKGGGLFKRRALLELDVVEEDAAPVSLVLEGRERDLLTLLDEIERAQAEDPRAAR